MTDVTLRTPNKTLADVVDDLGGVPLGRILFYPPPGTATERDVVDQEARARLCELVEGVLVEKPMGYLESILAIAIARHLANFAVPRKLGFVSGSDGMLRLFPGLVRIPDVAFASRDRFPAGKLPVEPIPDLTPDLAVEVVSISNTPAEMARKRREYFDAGVRLVWIVDPTSQTVAVFSSPQHSVELGLHDSLDGGDVLPGFSLAIAELFAELDAATGED
jgi:Uma2 family endonuclease